ncbi:MAG: hypothetical protein ACKVS5_15280 [Parvularculaceae bacterium]
MPAGRFELRNVLAWSYVVPVGSVWAIVSFLPAVGLFEKGASIVALVGELLFLASGLIGLAGFALGFTLLLAPERRREFPSPIKGRPILIAIYTTIWLAAYAAFQFVA